MPGLGTIVNAAAIVVGGLLGMLLKRILNKTIQDAVIKGAGVCVVFLGIAGAMEKMLSVSGSSLASSGSMLMILSFALGSILGGALDLEGKLEKFGQFLKDKTGSQNDNRFLDAFVTSSLTVSIGAMAVVGSIQDGLLGDHTTLFAKSLLDFLIIMVMAASLGKGCLFSAIPVAVLQGSVTVIARLIAPIMTDPAIDALGFVGSIMVFSIGVNIVWGKKIPVANMLPALIFAVVFSFIL